MAYINSHRFEGIVFHLDAIISEGDDCRKPEPMPHIRDAFNYLQSEGYKLILTAENRERALKALREFDLENVFTHEEHLQLCTMEQSRISTSENEPLIYWEGLKKLGLKTQEKLFAITSTVDGIKSARATGISNVIGYYGSPDIEFSRVSSFKESLMRKGGTISGATRSMGNYVDLPECIRFLKPTLNRLI